MKRRVLICGAWLGAAMTARLGAQSPVVPIPEPAFRAMVAPQMNLTPTPTPIVEISIPLQAGQMVRVFGRAEFFGQIKTASGKNYNYAEAGVSCVGSDGNGVGLWQVGQNYEGPTQPVGGNYPIVGHLVISPASLIQVRTSDTYTCQLLADTDKPTMVIGPQPYQDSPTWLRVSAPISTLAIPAAFAINDALSWTTASCTEGKPPPPGPGCYYLPPNPAESASAQPYFDVLSTSVSTPPSPASTSGAVQQVHPVWSPPVGAAFVDVVDNLEVSLCGHQLDSCPPQWGSGNKFSVVSTYLELVQLNAANEVCNKADSPIQETTFTDTPHHYTLYHRLAGVPVIPACGTPQFLVSLYVKSVSGSPVVVDGAQAVAFTTYHGTPQPVPHVVGLTQSAAAGALSAAGYVVNDVSSATNLAPQGLVLLQYPAAGVIELPSLGVDLTVSAGGVSVPRVVGLLDTRAEAALAALGLTANPTFKPGCGDTKTVQGQDPAANTTVAPHSAVILTLNNGKTTDGSPCHAE